MDDVTLTSVQGALRRGDVESRIAAIDVLGRSSDPRAVPLLIEALHDAHPHVRLTAAMELGFKKDKRAIQPLRRLLADPVAAVRERVVEALAALRASEVVLPLIEVLSSDRDAAVRQQAARALGEIRDPRAVTPLIGALGQGNWRDRQIPEALASIGPAAIEPLSRVVREGTARERVWATYALGLMAHPDTVPALLLALVDPVAEVRSWAPLGLRKTGDDRVTPALVKALGDPDEEVRAGIVAALGELRGDEALAALGRACADPDPVVRRVATEALARTNEPRTAGATPRELALRPSKFDVGTN
jgi:HEAT repeat protein